MAEQTPAAAPSLAGLLPLVRETPLYAGLRASVLPGPAGGGAPRLSLPPAMLAPLAAALHGDAALTPSASADRSLARRQSARPAMLLVVPRAEESKRLRDELALWLPDPAQALYFPEPEALPYERAAGDAAVSRQRLAVLTGLRAARGPLAGAGGAPVVVASVRGLLSPTIAPADLLAGCGVLQRGMAVNLTELLQGWLDLGYEPVAVVEEPGQFSRRGGIIDVFPPSGDQPVRVELFGDEIDSVRYFDPVSQRSLGPARLVTVAPPTEALPRMAVRASEALGELDLGGLNAGALEAWQADVERLRSGRVGGGLDLYAPYFSASLSCLADHFAGLVLLDSPELLAETAAGLHLQAEAVKAQLVERGELPAGFARPYLLWPELETSGALAASRCDPCGALGAAGRLVTAPAAIVRCRSTPGASSRCWTIASRWPGPGSAW